RGDQRGEDEAGGRGPLARTRTAPATGRATTWHTIRRVTFTALRHSLPRRGARRSSRAANSQGETKSGRFHAVAHSPRRSTALPSCENSALTKAGVQNRENPSHPSGPRST